MSEQTPYVLGHSDTELRRLESQARAVDPITRRFFVEAGVSAGMRVLDVGSGGGDVALLLADLVGPGGEVVGFDPSEVGITAARRKVAARGLSNVTFHAGTIDSIDLGDPFDAVAGRYVLQFQADPAELLAAVASHARPDGIVVFHELDWSGVSSDPLAPTYEQVCRWLQVAIGESGASLHSGLGLPATYASAGLGDPVLRIEQRAGAGTSAREVLERVTHLAESLAPTLIRLGIASTTDLDVDTLLDRMLAEVVDRRSLVRAHLQVGAWART
jgi:SAM-dependent methyltransferase